MGRIEVLVTRHLPSDDAGGSGISIIVFVSIMLVI